MQYTPEPSLLKTRQRTVRGFSAKANNNRTSAEKLADVLTSRLGSMKFLILNAVWFFGWIVINLGWVPNIEPFDPFPFGLLTMIVSLEAIFLAIIVLISQNREAKTSDLREEIDLQINTIAEEKITKMIELQVLQLKQHGFDLTGDTKLQQMLQPTDKARIKKSLEKQFKRSSGQK